MSKIDLTTKFLHGIAWDTKSDANRLRILQEILKDGKILSSRDIAIKKGADFTYKTDKIFLSVYPYGIYSSQYLGDGYNNGYTGYDMTTDSFYFILSRKLMSDFNIEAGCFPLECTVDKPIDLKKYLVGVGNAGYNINSNLIMCYYYTLYLKGIISQDKLISKIRNCLSPSSNYLQFQNNQVIWEIIECWAKWLSITGDTKYSQTIELVCEKPTEEFINPGCYTFIKRAFEENGVSTRFYDYEGYSVEPEKQLIKARCMQQYIRKNASHKK